MEFGHDRAGIWRMEIKHVPVYSRMSFLRILWRQSSPNRDTRVEQPSVLNKFFSELQYSAAFGRESRKFADRSQNMPNFVTFWSTL